MSADIDSIVNPVVVHDHFSECSKMLWNGLGPIRQREADTDEASMSSMLSTTVLDIAVWVAYYMFYVRIIAWYTEQCDVRDAHI